ncbi:hypothetical protein CK203_063470 [Vitis vinifera]|uniref:Uncharacterized protein n=1 Tax=Vitis vinifera TaxID=29760 RepID=A0A438FRQ2_VITVI|nr:hypothetical protein CK203_063470 [Vitis vinifera]
MAALLRFEEKVHTWRLTRADTIHLLFPQLLCHVLAHMGFPVDLILSPAAIVERASLLTNGISMAPSAFPEFPAPREVPPPPLSALSTLAPSEPVPKAASSDAPPAVSPYLKAAHYYPWCRVS